MRRLWIMFMTVAMVLVIALPVTAKKPDKHKPPSSVPIAVGIDAEPMWVHEGADVLRYTVTLENKTSAIINHVTVELSVATQTDEIWTGDLQANEIVALDGGSRLASSFAEFADCKVGDECPLSATASVYQEDVLVTQTTMSTPLMPDPACGFDYEGLDQINEVTVSDVCIWTPPQTGVWKITLAPTPPDNPNRPIGAVVAVRDGVPGNWCTLVDSDSTFDSKWRDGDDDVFGWVYLPGAENGPVLDDGMCLHGGAGGDYFAVGNPASFYLRANGTITTEWVRSTPQNR